MDIEGAKLSPLREKIQILDESTGHTRYVYSKDDSDENEHDMLSSKDSLSVEDFIFSGDVNRKSFSNEHKFRGGGKTGSGGGGVDNSKVLVIELDSPTADQRILSFIDHQQTSDSTFNNDYTSNNHNASHHTFSPAKKTTGVPSSSSSATIVALQSSSSDLVSSSHASHFFYNNNINNNNYSILSREVIAPLTDSTSKFKHMTTYSMSEENNNLASSHERSGGGGGGELTTHHSRHRPQKYTSKSRKSAKDAAVNSSRMLLGQEEEEALATSASSASLLKSPTSSTSKSSSSAKELATCQFCGRSMLKKNIPTHIRRAHTPKEELVCLNEEQNIFTLHHLRPGERRKRSARAYDYNLMTATVNIDDDPSEGIENKFITGEQILSTDLLQLADRIKYGIGEIPMSTLSKLVEVLTKIEYSSTATVDETECTPDSNSSNSSSSTSSSQQSLHEVRANAKNIRNLIYYYLTAGEEFKCKIKQVSEDIASKKNLVNGLRGDLKEVMSKKAHLERKIQPLVCELQRLEDQHGELIDSIIKESSMYEFEIVTTDNTTAGGGGTSSSCNE